ncbi:Uu.00g020640.m01.CDS01 [Anthostomella pinea]|uniref:Uu.00g020640.m01.CDS01 n=1 Tax=Anthostomella pinea TaxID=933095 RepID=A0AAI8W023_9PEZI|nr:Uu.00g020640.m01.CDS01 [Anthostomella pinea]
MSAQQANISMARTRSLRVPAKAALTAPQPALSTTSAAQVPCCTSNVLLFLTNLRLLDLDKESDWPAITPATLSARDAAGGQKRRIQCVEWALYQLFLLWDYHEAQNKLRPFYPPLDQVQSINLRAALLRGLEQAKKNGVLGRDAVIRKTMLDECKGERLEEVLAVFSSAVLKRLVAERAPNSGPEYRPAISESVALENWGYSGDRTELNALLLAHKASLRSLLEKKSAARERYRDFEELLALKERGISRRREQAKPSAGHQDVEASDEIKAEVRRILRNNWTGNEQWIDSILFNDTQPRKGGLLGSRFDEVWSGVQAGRISDLEDQSAGLLEQLDDRVRLQKRRLEKWDDFRKKTFRNLQSPQHDDKRTEKKPKGLDLGLNGHLELNLDQSGTQEAPSLDAPPPEYARILQGMKTELGGIAKIPLPNFSNLLGGIKRVPRIDASQYLTKPEPVVEPVSDLGEWEDEPEVVQPPKPAEPSTRHHKRQISISGGRGLSQRQIPKAPVPEDHRRDSKDPIPSTTRSLERPKRRVPSPPTTQELQNGPKEPIEPIVATPNFSHDEVKPHGDSPHDPSPGRLAPRENIAEDAIPPPPRPSSATQILADEILASMSNASPSPVKRSRHTLSLAERTRMSMTRMSSFDADDVTPQLSSSKTSPIKASGTITVNDIPEQGEEYEDLVARTRRSMAGFEAARQKAQLDRKRSQRKSKVVQRKDSYFPTLDEENVGDASVAEELMEASHEDYEAIFKSRPRIATSPSPSPSKLGHE